MPKLFTKKGPSNFVLLFLAVILLALLAIFGFKSIFLTQADFPIPAFQYPDNAVKLNYDMTDVRKALDAAGNHNDTNGLKTEGFKVKSASQPGVIDKFVTQMQKDGWTLVSTENYYLFRKGAQTLSFAANPVDQLDIDYLNGITPDVAQQVAVGDVLIIFLYGPYDKLVVFE